MIWGREGDMMSMKLREQGHVKIFLRRGIAMSQCEDEVGRAIMVGMLRDG